MGRCGHTRPSQFGRAELKLTGNIQVGVRPIALLSECQNLGETTSCHV